VTVLKCLDDRMLKVPLGPATFPHPFVQLRDLSVAQVGDVVAGVHHYRIVRQHESGRA
jgi:hypothetical protein